MNSKDQHVLERLGEGVLAPVVRQFVLWLHREAKRDGVERLVFLARDGYLLWQAYQRVVAPEEQLPSCYMWASRRVLNVASIVAVDEPTLDFLMGDRDEMPVEEYLRRIGLRASDHLHELRQAGFADPSVVVRRRDMGRLEVLFQRLEAAIVAQARRERMVLLRYASGLADWQHERCGVIDAGWHGTLQRSLARVLEVPEGYLRGYYLGLHRSANKAMRPYMKAFLEEDRPGDGWWYAHTVRRAVEILEMLLAEPDQSVVGIKQIAEGRFEAVRERAADNKLTSQVRIVQAAALAVLNEPKVATKGRTGALWELARLMSRPRPNEARVLGELEHQSGFGGYGKFAALARPTFGPGGYVLRPGRLVADWHQAFWKRGFWVRMLTNK